MSSQQVVVNNESLAATAFSSQSGSFDELYAGNRIVQYKRQSVRDHLLKYISPGQSVLELNSGTGEDALWLAQQGYRVHATDLAAGMQEQLREKVLLMGSELPVSQENCSFTELNQLNQKGPFDVIFSNFAGLNCTGELDRVLASFPPLLKPHGIVTLVILPPFCLWEFLLMGRGKFRTATRRFFSRNGRQAHLEGHFFKCWYYRPSYVIRCLKKDFEVLSLEGLCTLVPPSYLENFPQRFPRTYHFLQNRENKWRGKWPWKYLGDYYMISLRKK